MFKNISSNIKKVFVIALFFMFLTLILGIILNSKIILSLSLGIATSVISNFFLFKMAYEIVYLNKGLKYTFFRFILSYALYALILYIDFIIYKDIVCVITTGLAFLIFKIILTIYYILKN
ncbi:hypothetical protein [Caviibacter abscessus]|uniref:hypothetical protein n=1 Tax=Caviibacter abscessus TaxID=1766719 RepID=UPI0008337203|nr:hypothetical protein [Caviibacter abscessus]